MIGINHICGLAQQTSVQRETLKKNEGNMIIKLWISRYKKGEQYWLKYSKEVYVYTCICIYIPTNSFDLVRAFIQISFVKN